MSSLPSQRGRKVTTPKRNPLVPFYIGVGALLLVGAAFLVTFMLRSGNSAEDITRVDYPVGQTAEGFWYKGNADAPVKVIKYSDYQCPACAFYYNNLGEIIQRDYINTGKVQFIYHEFPLDSHQHAIAAGQAARCAGDQGKYWQMHNMLFTNQDQWSSLSTVKNVFSGYAGQIGLNRTEFDACVANGAHVDELTAAGQSAVAAGVQATPTFGVNGTLTDATGLPGAIEAALRAAGQ